MKPPYGVFAHNMNDSSILGVQSSYCGLSKLAHIVAGVDTQNQNVVGMTNRGLGGNPKEQFYINNLTATSKYWGFLAMPQNSTPGVIGGGGKVWMAMNFTTKTGKPVTFSLHVSGSSKVLTLLQNPIAPSCTIFPSAPKSPTLYHRTQTNSLQQLASQT